MFGSRSRLTKPIVLIVDDDPTMRDLLGRAFSESGVPVQTAMNIRQAIKVLSTSPVAAVVSDMLFVNSAGQSGLDVLRYVRATPHLHHLPVIVLTGFLLNKAVVTEIESLSGELWHKPISVRALVERVTKMLPATARPDEG